MLKQKLEFQDYTPSWGFHLWLMLIGEGWGGSMKYLTSRQVPEQGFRLESSGEIMGSRKMNFDDFCTRTGICGWGLDLGAQELKGKA